MASMVSPGGCHTQSFADFTVTLPFLVVMYRGVLYRGGSSDEIRLIEETRIAT
jgi:hypothetical protein